MSASEFADPVRVEALYGDRLVPCYADRPRNLDAMIRRAVALRPQATAVEDEQRTLSYAQLDSLANRLAQALAARGIAPGDRVATFLGNGAEFIVLLAALWRMGAIAVPVGTRQSADELAYMLSHCEAAALVFDAELAERVPSAERIPSVRHLVRVDSDASLEPSSPEATEFWQLLEEGSDSAWHAEFDDQHAACIMYTSGTTGQPKGAVLTHLGFFHTARHYERVFGYRHDDRMLLVIPGSHISGLLAVVVVMLQVGGCVVCMRQFQAEAVLEKVETHRITAAVMVPAMYNLCLLVPGLAQRDLSCWRIGHFGGAAMPEITIQKLAELLPGLELYNGFGATETTSAVTLTRTGDAARHLDSVGTVVPCVDIRVLDEEGREVPTGQAGELWIRSPGNARAYWNNPDATRAAFVAGYWRSGDVGSIDAAGFVRVFDRLKDMINRGGFKVYCVELENTLQRFPGVIEAAAVASPCPVLGERIHVYLHAHEPIDPQSVRNFCRDSLADYKTPDHITISDTPLPRNLNGKIVKATLRERARAHAAAASHLTH